MPIWIGWGWLDKDYKATYLWGECGDRLAASFMSMDMGIEYLRYKCTLPKLTHKHLENKNLLLCILKTKFKWKIAHQPWTLQCIKWQWSQEERGFWQWSWHTFESYPPSPTSLGSFPVLGLWGTGSKGWSAWSLLFSARVLRRHSFPPGVWHLFRTLERKLCDWISPRCVIFPDCGFVGWTVVGSW